MSSNYYSLEEDLEKGGIDLDPNALDMKALQGVVYTNLSLETIRKFKTNNDLKIKSVEISDGVNSSSQ